MNIIKWVILLIVGILSNAKELSVPQSASIDSEKEGDEYYEDEYYDDDNSIEYTQINGELIVNEDENDQLSKLLKVGIGGYFPTPIDEYVNVSKKIVDELYLNETVLYYDCILRKQFGVVQEEEEEFDLKVDVEKQIGELRRKVEEVAQLTSKLSNKGQNPTTVTVQTTSIPANNSETQPTSTNETTNSTLTHNIKTGKRLTFREKQEIKMKERREQEAVRELKRPKFRLGAPCESLICGSCKNIVEEFIQKVYQNKNNENFLFIGNLTQDFCKSKEISLKYIDMVGDFCLNFETDDLGYISALIKVFDNVGDWKNIDSIQSKYQKKKEVCLEVGACQESDFMFISTPQVVIQEQWDDKCFVCQAFASDLEEKAQLTRHVTEGSIIGLVSETCDRMMLPAHYDEICRTLTKGKLLDDISWLSKVHDEAIRRKAKGEVKFPDKICEEIDYCQPWIDPEQLKEKLAQKTIENSTTKNDRRSKQNAIDLHNLFIEYHSKYEEGVMHDFDFGAIYILSCLSTMKPNSWTNGKLNMKIIDHDLLLQKESMKLCQTSLSFQKLVNVNYIKKLLCNEFDNMDDISLMDIFNYIQLKGMKSNKNNLVNVCMINWALGYRNILLMFHIPTPKDVLNQQCSHERVVTMFIDQINLSKYHESILTYLSGMPPIYRDPLEFFIHDLNHMEHFSDTQIHDEQVGFFRCMYSLNNHQLQDYFINQLGYDDIFWLELEYVISDMNCYSTHLLRYLYAKMFTSTARLLHDKKVRSDGSNDEMVKEKITKDWNHLLNQFHIYGQQQMDHRENGIQLEYHNKWKHFYDSAMILISSSLKLQSEWNESQAECIRDYFKYLG